MGRTTVPIVVLGLKAKIDHRYLSPLVPALFIFFPLLPASDFSYPFLSLATSTFVGLDGLPGGWPSHSPLRILST